MVQMVDPVTLPSSTTAVLVFLDPPLLTHPARVGTPQDVMDGFGVSAVRPWVDPRIEELRLRDGAAEVLDLAWGRLRILEETGRGGWEVRGGDLEKAWREDVVMNSNI